jgi:CheY-like chemotaxis protein
MPIMDGMSATRAIREFERENNLPRTYVIALTGLASATARLEAWSSGVDYYATKPVNFKALQKIFSKATGREGS